jgi:hypothetical protein
MKNYTVHYDVVTAVQHNDERKVISVIGKQVTLSNAADNLDVQAAAAAIEGLGTDSIVITACSSSDVVPS